MSGGLRKGKGSRQGEGRGRGVRGIEVRSTWKWKRGYVKEGVIEGGGLMREVVLFQKALYLVIKFLVLDLKKKIKNWNSRIGILFRSIRVPITKCCSLGLRNLIPFLF